MTKQIKILLKVGECPFCGKLYVERLWDNPCKHFVKVDFKPPFIIIFKKGDVEKEVESDMRQCRLHVPID